MHALANQVLLAVRSMGLPHITSNVAPYAALYLAQASGPQPQGAGLIERKGHGLPRYLAHTLRPGAVTVIGQATLRIRRTLEHTNGRVCLGPQF